MAIVTEIHSGWRRVARRTAAATGAVTGGALLSTLGIAYYVARVLTDPKRPSTMDTYTMTPFETGADFEQVSFPQVRGGQLLHGWWFPRPETRRVIVGCHGYRSSKSELIGIATALWRAGFNVLLFDYHGHGAAIGSPVTLGYREVNDVFAALDYAERRVPTPRSAFLVSRWARPSPSSPPPVGPRCAPWWRIAPSPPTATWSPTTSRASSVWTAGPSPGSPNLHPPHRRLPQPRRGAGARCRRPRAAPAADHPWHRRRDHPRRTGRARIRRRRQAEGALAGRWRPALRYLFPGPPRLLRPRQRLLRPPPRPRPHAGASRPAHLPNSTQPRQLSSPRILKQRVSEPPPRAYIRVARIALAQLG